MFGGCAIWGNKNITKNLNIPNFDNFKYLRNCSKDFEKVRKFHTIIQETKIAIKSQNIDPVWIGWDIYIKRRPFTSLEDYTHSLHMVASFLKGENWRVPVCNGLRAGPKEHFYAHQNKAYLFLVSGSIKVFFPHESIFSPNRLRFIWVQRVIPWVHFFG
jgi:hypothetical protein